MFYKLHIQSDSGYVDISAENILWKIGNTCYIRSTYQSTPLPVIPYITVTTCLDKQWFAVYTRPRWEKKTAALLQQLHIETYCPVNKVVKRWADRKKTILEPLFTSYCFVRIVPADQLLVRQTPGVINFVYWLGRPAVIRDEEICLIKQFLNEHEAVKLERLAVAVHDRVRITRGALTAQEGAVVEVRTQTVRIQLPAMGVALIAEVAKSGVELVRPGK